jgi:hypothetical protein
LDATVEYSNVITSNHLDSSTACICLILEKYDVCYAYVCGVVNAHSASVKNCGIVQKHTFLYRYVCSKKYLKPTAVAFANSFYKGTTLDA